MKMHKQTISIETYNGLLEVISFYETRSQTYGADIFFQDKLLATHQDMKNEPIRDHLVSLGYHYAIIIERKQPNLTIL